MLDFFIMNPTTISSDERKEENIHNLYKMLDYLEETVVCRRKLQLNLLGEDFSSKKCNNNCDNCIKNEFVADRDVTGEAKDIINFIGEVGKGRLTIPQAIDALRGVGTIPPFIKEKGQKY